MGDSQELMKALAAELLDCHPYVGSIDDENQEKKGDWQVFAP